MFAHLSKLNPVRTYWLDLPELGPDAAIELRFAGESNRPYYNAMLKRAASRARGRGGRGNLARLAADQLEKNRAEDRDLFPAHVLTGNWKGICDESGQAVECTLENRRELCKELPWWIFDRVRNAACSPENFVEEIEEPAPDVEDLAGN